MFGIEFHPGMFDVHKMFCLSPTLVYSGIGSKNATGERKVISERNCVGKTRVGCHLMNYNKNKGSISKIHLLRNVISD